MNADQIAFAMPEVVQSVVESPTNGPLIAVAAQLWMRPDDLVVDVTYGRGLFWTRHRPARLVAHDLALDGVDFRQRPRSPTGPGRAGALEAGPQLPVHLRGAQAPGPER